MTDLMKCNKCWVLAPKSEMVGNLCLGCEGEYIEMMGGLTDIECEEEGDQVCFSCGEQVNETTAWCDDCLDGVDIEENNSSKLFETEEY